MKHVKKVTRFPKSATDISIDTWISLIEEVLAFVASIFEGKDTSSR